MISGYTHSYLTNKVCIDHFLISGIHVMRGKGKEFWMERGNRGKREKDGKTERSTDGKRGKGEKGRGKEGLQ